MSAPTTENPARILVVDDEPTARAALVELLRDEGFAVRSAADGFKALGQLDDWSADLVITDVRMPGIDGIELMRKLRERDESVAVIVITAYGTLEHAVAAMQDGADDYLTKPVQFPELLVVVRRTLASHRLRRENAQLKAELAAQDAAPELEWIGRSQPARELLALVRQVADSDAAALLIGPAGTGKALLTQMLHAWSPRRSGPFVAVSCVGLAAPALESALQRAEGGTLLLEDVGELAPQLQGLLLARLQAPASRGADDDAVAQPSDLRLVAAHTRELHDDVREGRFSAELFYRLDVVTLRTPALAERREDIPALASYLLGRHARRAGKPMRGFTDRALRTLCGADWPGNVHELESCIQHAIAACDGDEIQPRHLPREFLQHARPGSELPPIPGTSLAELEKYAILKTLEQVRGSTSKAAEILGISPRKIQYRLAEYRGEAGDDPDDGRSG